MQTQLSDVTDAEMTYGRWKGHTYNFIIKQKPSYITWARTQIPNCGTELFRLVQFADSKQLHEGHFELKWGKLRKQHYIWMQDRKIKRFEWMD